MELTFNKLSPRFNQGYTGASLFTIIPVGVYNTTAPSLVNGQANQIQVDQAGNILTSLPYTYKNVVAGQATTVIKSSAGFLHSIIFNTAATATSTMVLYDNTAASGTKIGSITATGLTPPVSIIFDLNFTTGLTCITATANGADMTFVYR